jgi:hypothetical protein
MASKTFPQHVAEFWHVLRAVTAGLTQGEALAYLEECQRRLSESGTLEQEAAYFTALCEAIGDARTGTRWRRP